ncbi:MerR family transcriptional regulator [Actinopolyspora mortivallis]|uniref:MerR family transcriptional regulator n=1 Tax=Actinopolyspora mortivallis TaxID=33906 RepID=A0A2T0H215_ACTMO|nr:MerR family transcriptional regulator [Actinopolyspora mortivallis]PRW65380.1 MerR family transcriptional regulator [Actinopolyspora mortivallis]
MSTANPGRFWKVGELAAATGLTVRTLHHYDHVGLVCPSRRTDSGHRLYAEADVRRLYQVLALRQLGLSLEETASVLAGSADIDEVLTAHERHLRQRREALRRLQAQVSTLRAGLRESPPTSVDGFLDLIRKVVVVDETVKRYFNDSQLAELAERRQQLGEQTIAEVERAWSELIPRVEAAVASGMDPTTPEAQEMAREWMGLLEQFHGGDEGLRESLQRMYEDNAEQIEQRYCGPTQAQLDFIGRAEAARRNGR